MEIAIIKKSVKCPNFLARPAWRAVEILQKGGIMVRMSMSALLGAAFAAFFVRIYLNKRDMEVCGCPTHAESDWSVFAPISGGDIMIMYRVSRATRPKTRPIYAPLVLL